ncbi:MAG TPA: hypothetical protein VHH36_07520 [Candidatus Thermoplasmatota archaeon]|nr:hypothetical protein [Candidatus Thermoplasmatota archaeon]
MKKDMVIGIVGTAILVTAMVGVFRFEAGQTGSSFDVAFPTTASFTTSETGRTTLDAPTPLQVDVNASNLTRVVWTLTWTDDEPTSTGADTLVLKVTSPSGKTQEAQAANGTVTVVFEDLNPPPAPARLAGSDRAAAEARARDLYTTTGGAGAWNVTVTVASTGAQQVPNPGLPVPIDDGNDWTLGVEGQSYRAELTPA